MTTKAKDRGLEVVFCESEGHERGYLDACETCSGWDIRYVEETVNELPDEVREAVSVLSCFIRSRVDREFIETCPNLKLVATRSAGYDHIDLKTCGERGITVCNVPQYGDNTVAEHTLGLILALSRHIYEGVDRVKRGSLGLDGLLGFDLHGKTLGVIGAGRIGLRVARFGVALNMRVLAYDVRPNDLLAEVVGFEYRELDELLSESDVVSVHVPLMPATHHLLNAERLALMKPTAVLVNTSRGGIIDSRALLDALNQERLAAAALDVLENEDVITEDRVLTRDLSLEKLRLAVESYQLIHHPRVLVTPHMAFYSQEALQRILTTTVENIAGFAAGSPVNVVAPPA